MIVDPRKILDWLSTCNAYMREIQRSEGLAIETTSHKYSKRKE